MTPLTRTDLELEMARARRRHAWLLAEITGALEAPCTWELLEEALCWHVVLRDALEPDVDVQVLEEALIVRAAAPDRMRQALLPVPAPFDAARMRIRFESGLLEIRIQRRRS